MRITQSMIARVGLDQLSAQRNRLARTQEMAATGKRLNRPSDDPVDYRTVSFLKDGLGQTDRFLRSIDLARTRIATTENALDGAALALSQAKTQGLAAANETNFVSDASLDAIKIQVAGVFDELLSFANVRSSGGAYVFSGRESDTPAFTSAGAFGSGTAPTVTFTGEASVVEVEIDEDVFVGVNRDGQSAFQGASDAFAAVTDLWTAIDQKDRPGINAAINELDAAFNNLVLERAELGAGGAKADSFEERLRLQEQDFVSRISFLEDADAFEVYTDLTAQETALQASLQVTTRLLQPTLLDYI